MLIPQTFVCENGCATDAAVRGSVMLVGYARVSTQDQNLQLQHDALKAAHCARIFDDKLSGAKAERPGLTAAIESMTAGDTLVVWKLSRLGRSMKQLIDTVQRLSDKGIELKSLHENIDTTSATGKLLFHIIAAFAQFERDNMIENTRAGLAAARSRGRIGGRRPKVDDAKLAEAAALLTAHPKLTPREICRRLGISRATFYRRRLAEPQPEYTTRRAD